MFVLFTIIAPTIKVYFIDGVHFTTNKKEAFIFNSREEAIKKQSDFDFDMQIEKLEA